MLLSFISWPYKLEVIVSALLSVSVTNHLLSLRVNKNFIIDFTFDNQTATRFDNIQIFAVGENKSLLRNLGGTFVAGLYIIAVSVSS